MLFPKPFSKEIFKFSCTNCSICCKYEPGFVFLSHNDLEKILEFLKVDFEFFKANYCKNIYSSGKTFLTLKEKTNLDCIMWSDGGCKIHNAKPTQCRAFPFWTDYITKKSEWDKLKTWCPGIDIGKTYTSQEIIPIVEEYKESKKNLL